MGAQSFKKTQYDFAAHIRNPDEVAGPEGIEDRRLAIYRELFFNNVESFVSSGFPVLRTLYSDEAWQQLIRIFFARHKAKTPHFPEMAEEFVDFLQNEFTPGDNDPPFIVELAHYEWMETALMLLNAGTDDVAFNVDGDLMEQPVVISPLAWLLFYEWPVHTISSDTQPKEKPEQPTWIVIHRDRKDEVGFMHLNPVTARLIQLLDDEGTDLTGRQALEQIAQELNHPQPEVIIAGGLDTLRQLRKKEIILGTAVVQ
jgi:hypothetical protein